jgi:glycosyltransferase involved in cell wall biosynthesis
MRILFIAPLYPERSPSQRFRFEQYLDFLKEKNIEYSYSYLVSEKHDRIFYSKGNLLKKLYLLILFTYKRFQDLRSASKYDVVFIQREAFYLGTTFFEKRLAKKTKVIFDFDDSIWLNNVSDANKNLNFLKNPVKTSEIIKFVHLVVAGNNYLSEYAKQFNSNVKILPTIINTDEYKKVHHDKDQICIGWSGSVTTIQHFEYAIPFLTKIKKKFGDKVYIKVIGDGSYINNNLDIKGLSWNKESEIEDLSEFDIGIMPLPNDEWAKGKCGLKGLQYMALEIPTIMSPVGVNSEIIKDGVNGFLADSIEEWENKLSRLIESEELRSILGKKGRDTVVEKYSTDATKEIFIEYLNEVIN